MTQLNSDFTAVTNRLPSDRIWFSATDYTDITIDGTIYAGATSVLWLVLAANSTRRMAIGYVYTTNSPQAWSAFVSKPKLLIQNLIDGTWSNLRSL